MHSMCVIFKMCFENVSIGSKRVVRQQESSKAAGE